MDGKCSEIHSAAIIAKKDQNRHRDDDK